MKPVRSWDECYDFLKARDEEVRSLWRSVMDPDYNPLMHLPKMVRFQIMTYLSIMWCMVFTAWTGLIVTLGPSIAIHMILLIGVFFTGHIFKKYNRFQTHRDLYKDADGCAKYDDIWGG